MDLQPFKIPQYQAREQFLAYREAYRKSHAAEDEALMRGYREVARGNTVIALQNVMKIAGLNEQGYPRLAIARADQKQVTVEYAHIGAQYLPCACIFTDPQFPKRKPIVIEHGAFPAWPGETRWQGELRPKRHTIVPNVPPQYRPRYDLANYHILWEVLEWRKTPPLDPALLKDLGGGLFAVLAVWDLSPLEQAVLGSTRVRLPR